LAVVKFKLIVFSPVMKLIKSAGCGPGRSLTCAS
jgi:hypothetical protein